MVELSSQLVKGRKPHLRPYEVQKLYLDLFPIEITAKIMEIGFRTGSISGSNRWLRPHIRKAGVYSGFRRHSRHVDTEPWQMLFSGRHKIGRGIKFSVS